MIDNDDTEYTLSEKGWLLIKLDRAGFHTIVADDYHSRMLDWLVGWKDQAVREAIQKCVSIIEYSVSNEHDRKKCIARIVEGHEQHLNAMLEEKHD